MTSKILAFQKKILSYYKRNRRDLPWRKTTAPYAIMVSEIMLQQTQVERVILKYDAWMKRFPTVAALAQASLADVIREWSGLGYNRRAKMLHDAAKAIVQKYDGKIPRDIDILTSLPGIGPYTARAILIFANNANIATVDTNIRRILIHEFRLSEKISQQELFDLAGRCVPKGKSRDWHNALMDYGALRITARRTGIRPTSRQTRFHGSVRQARGRILRLLLEKKHTRKELTAMLQSKHVVTALNELEREQLIEKNDGKYGIRK